MFYNTVKKEQKIETQFIIYISANLKLFEVLIQLFTLLSCIFEMNDEILTKTLALLYIIHKYLYICIYIMRTHNFTFNMIFT